MRSHLLGGSHQFLGESFVVDAGGLEIARAPAMEEHLLIADLDGRETRWRRITFPVPRDERPNLVQREQKCILRTRGDNSAARIRQSAV